MKIKFLSLGVMLALLVSNLGMPLAVSASTSVVNGEIGIAPHVTGCSPNSGAHPEGEIPVTITGDNFTQSSVNASSVSVSGTGVTVGPITVVNATTITTNFTIAADAAQGARNVSVNVSGQIGTGIGIFTVSYYITVTAPSAVAMGLMTVGVPTENSSITPGTVESNYSTWTVTAKDNNQSTNSGKMLKDTTPLANKLKIGSSTTPTADADTGFTYPGKPVTLPFYASQTADAADTAGSYTITIAFTGNGS